MTQANRMPQPGLKPKDLVGIPWRVALALQDDGWWLRSDIVWAKPAPMPESVEDRCTRSHEYIFHLVKSEKYYWNAEAIAEKSIAARPSGNGYARSERLSQAGRGSDEPWKPAGKHSAQPEQSSGRRMTEAVARARAEGAEHDSQFGDTRNCRDVWTFNSEAFPEAHFAVMPSALARRCVLAGCPPGGIVLDPFAGASTTLVVSKELGCRAIGIELNEDYLAMSIRRLRQEVLEFA